MNTLALWLTVTIGRNGFIRYPLASGLQCDGCRCKNLSSRPFYPRAKCNSLFTNFTQHSLLWLLTIHRSFLPSPVVLLSAMTEIACTQPTMWSTVKSCKATAAGAFLLCTKFETVSKLPEFSGSVVSARANQYSTRAPSSLRSLILNCCCSCHGRPPFSAPSHLPGCCSTQTQWFCWSPPRQLWLPVHWHIWDLSSPCKPSTWTLILWEIKSSIGCNCSYNIYILLWLICLLNSCMLLYIVTQCVTSCVLSSNARKCLIIASGFIPSRRVWRPMHSGFAYDWELRGAAR